MAKKVMVTWTEASPHGVAVRAQHGTPEVIQFLPGVNFVDADDWELLKKNERVQYYIKQGQFIEDASGAVEDKDVALSLEMRTPAEAVAIVSECFDDELLAAWAAVEKRAEVAAAIVAQRNSIDPKADAEAKAAGASNPEISSDQARARKAGKK